MCMRMCVIILNKNFWLRKLFMLRRKFTFYFIASANFRKHNQCDSMLTSCICCHFRLDSFFKYTQEIYIYTDCVVYQKPNKLKTNGWKRCDWIVYTSSFAIPIMKCLNLNIFKANTKIVCEDAPTHTHTLIYHGCN